MRMQRYLLSLVVWCAVVAAAGRAAATPITFNPTSGSAGDVVVGQSGTTTFAIENGPGAIEVTLVESGTHCDEFSAEPMSQSIPNNASRNVVVTFTPALGSRGARGPCTYTTTADGEADTFAATGFGRQPNMMVSTTSLAFGNRTVGSSTQLNVTVTNPSPANVALVVNSSITGAGFSVTPATRTINPGAPGQTFTVTFAPGSATSFSGTLTLTSNDEANKEVAIALTGTGVQAIMTSSLSGTTFGSAHVGVASTTTRTLTVTNDASASQSLTFTVATTGDFAANPSSGTLTAGSSTNVTVTFTPTLRGNRTGTVTVSGNDPSNASDAYNISGTGTSPNMVTTWAGSPGALGFGSARVNGGVNQRTVTITNSNTSGANEPLTFAVEVTSGGSDFNVVPPAVTTLAVGQSTNVTVNFDPSAVGTRSGVLTITGNDAFNPSDTVDLTGTGTNAVISLSPSPLAFGNVHVGTSGNQTLVVDNTGNAPMTVTAMSITGTNANQFAFTDHGCTGQTCNLVTPFVVDPGADFENVVVRCSPTSRGAKTATLTVTGDHDSGTNTVTLNCTGTEPDINVTPTSLAFGNVVIGTTPQLTFQIQNTVTGIGAETLDYTITKTGAGAAAFTVNPPCTTTCTVVPGAAQTITVTFTPTLRQAYAATLTINSDDPDEASVVVTLTGTGVAPVIGNPTPANRILSFGAVDVGATSAALTASIQNTGDAPLSITSVALAGTNPGQFTITSGPTGASTVAAGGTGSWQVACRPTSIGAKTAILRITSNGLGTSTYDFTLDCTGQQAIFTFSPPAGLDFGGVNVGTSMELTATITNTGNKVGTVQSIVSGNAVFTFTVTGGAPPRSVPAGGSLSVVVRFTPVNGNVISSNLTVMTDGTPASFNIPLLGDGQTQGIDLAVAGDDDLMVQLGAIRVNQPTTRRVTATNTGDSSFAISQPSSNDPRCTIQTVSFPPNLPGGGQATFDVTVTPTALGSGTCTIIVATNIPSSDTIVFTFVGAAPEVELVNPTNGELDYAGVDVDAGPVVEDVIIRNSGTFPLTISGCSRTGTSTRFTIQTDCTAIAPLAPSQTATIQVAFDPIAEAIELATLNISVDADSTNLVQIALEGVGVDQRIGIPLAVSFADTYRNPADHQVDTQPLPIVAELNPQTGYGADLTVSMFVLDPAYADVFVIDGAAPFTITAGQTRPVPIEFRPPQAGVEFVATLVVHNDATGQDVAQVTLRGRGISRQVGVPAQINLGTTGVGVPRDLGEPLVLTNMAPGETFRVEPLVFVDVDHNPIDGAPFVVVGDGQPRDLTDTLDYQLELVPDQPGTFSHLLAVYLDGDPEPHALIEVTGEAVEIDIHGSGCQAGRGRAGWAAPLVLALAVLAGRRRRRGLAAIAVVAAAGIGAPSARAEPTRTLEVSTFAPLPTTEVESFTVESPTVGVAGAWAISFGFDHATRILVVDSPARPDMTDVPISARTALRLGVAYAFLDQFEAGLRVPVYQQSGEAPQFSGMPAADGSALGDVAAHLKAQLARGGAAALAASLDVTLPTGTDAQYAGVDGPSGHLRMIAGWRSQRVGVNVNGGFVMRRAGVLGNLTQGNAISFGGGAHVRALDSLWVIGEAFGSSGLGSEGSGVQQLEGVVGVRYEVGRTVGVSVGGGRGILSGIGAPAIRGFLLFDVAPRARAREPLVVVKPPAPRDLGDNDGDGIANADDACPDDAEDLDGYKDDDGCPEADNDMDGILDVNDLCPDDAEDLDGFEDDDGCPDLDNDKDGIPDVDDLCPNEAEDRDGYLDNDGCDDPDNDGDGIPDVIDHCALEPETINGIQDDDGCPDDGDSLVMVMPDRIEVFEPIMFEGKGAKLSKKSANVLGQVAATMRANRDFKRVRVTVHVHPRGSGDQDLSEKRAKAVREWLVSWGIEPERLEARGLGSKRPLVPKKQKGAEQLNDRVEFILLEKEVTR
jgi:outer membrane protein OmpA-like peptidoglycan-associated protein